MVGEREIPYSERTATVVGGGELGSRVASCYREIGFKHVRICEKGDPLLDFLNGSTDLFLAVGDEEILLILPIARPHLQDFHTLLDGASNKTNLIEPYREIDEEGVSVGPSHLGARPDHPWRGVKVWLCHVGPNSDRAIRLGTDLFLAKNSSIRIIDIEEHQQVETDQFVTFSGAYVISEALKEMGIPLKVFDEFATLNSEIQAMHIGRSLGQGTVVPSEVIFRQRKKQEIIGAMKAALEKLEAVVEDREELQQFMQGNINFHNNSEQAVAKIFRKAGVVGFRNANLRMYSFSFRVVDDRPGRLLEVLPPFYFERANLTAIDSMPGVITEEEKAQGVDPDRIVDFDVGIDPKTIDSDKDRRIKERLVEMGCKITVSSD